MRWLRKFSRPFRLIAQRVVQAALVAATGFIPSSRSGSTDEEYQELIEMAFQHEAALAAREKEIILQIINLDRRKAGDVFCGRTQMVSISDELSVPEMLWPSPGVSNIDAFPFTTRRQTRLSAFSTLRFSCASRTSIYPLPLNFLHLCRRA